MRSSQKLQKALNRLASVGAVLGALFVVSGCANRQVRSADPVALYPTPHTVVAEPGENDDVEIVERHYVEETTTTDSGTIGYHELSTGDRVEVVTYVHTYPDPIESFPRVYWGGAWYYNVHGDFVFYDPYYGSWAYYHGPPRPLVACWNGYYPYAPYYWGVGYYGAGWYWGGVGVYGYHAYGIPVTNTHHHHHHHYDRPPSPGSSSQGGPSGAGKPSPGAPGSPIAAGPRRTRPDSPPTRTSTTVGMTDPFNTRSPAQRSPARAPSWGQTVTSKPTRTAPSRATPSFTPSRSGFGTSTRSTPSRSPSRAAPSRAAPSRTTPSRSMPSRSPSRTTPSRSMPSRSPSRSAPSRSAPSRSSRSAPSRSSRSRR